MAAPVNDHTPDRELLSKVFGPLVNNPQFAGFVELAQGNKTTKPPVQAVAQMIGTPRGEPFKPVNPSVDTGEYFAQVVQSGGALTMEQQKNLPHRGASVQNDSHWTTLDEALQSVGSRAVLRINDADRECGAISGVGVRLGKISTLKGPDKQPVEGQMTEDKILIGIDIDHCIDPKTGEMNDFAKQVCEQFRDTYGEVSISGQGLHFLMYGDSSLTQEARNWSQRNPQLSLEVYTGRRYFTLSGNPVQGRPTPVKDMTATFREFANKYVPQDLARKRQAEKAPSQGLAKVARGPRERPGFVLYTPKQLWDVMMNEADGPKVKAIRANDFSSWVDPKTNIPDESRAAGYLLLRTAFKTRFYPSREERAKIMTAVFLQTGLETDKYRDRRNIAEYPEASTWLEWQVYKALDHPSNRHVTYLDHDGKGNTFPITEETLRFGPPWKMGEEGLQYMIDHPDAWDNIMQFTEFPISMGDLERSIREAVHPDQPVADTDLTTNRFRKGYTREHPWEVRDRLEPWYHIDQPPTEYAPEQTLAQEQELTADSIMPEEWSPAAQQPRMEPPAQAQQAVQQPRMEPPRQAEEPAQKPRMEPPNQAQKPRTAPPAQAKETVQKPRMEPPTQARQTAPKPRMAPPAQARQPAQNRARMAPPRQASQSAQNPRMAPPRQQQPAQKPRMAPPPQPQQPAPQQAARPAARADTMPEPSIQIHIPPALDAQAAQNAIQYYKDQGDLKFMRGGTMKFIDFASQVPTMSALNKTLLFAQMRDGDGGAVFATDIWKRQGMYPKEGAHEVAFTVPNRTPEGKVQYDVVKGYFASDVQSPDGQPYIGPDMAGYAPEQIMRAFSCLAQPEQTDAFRRQSPEQQTGQAVDLLVSKVTQYVDIKYRTSGEDEKKAIAGLAASIAVRALGLEPTEPIPVAVTQNCNISSVMQQACDVSRQCILATSRSIESGIPVKGKKVQRPAQHANEQKRHEPKQHESIR